MIGAMQDVTERKTTENSLLEAEDRYRRLVELSPEPIFVHQDMKYVYANRAGVLGVVLVWQGISDEDG